jgi:hypothetical protein
VTRRARARCVGLLCLVGACANGRPRAEYAETGLGRETARDAAQREPQWQDALGARPEFLVSLRPKALREDRVYGPLLRVALGLARQQSRVVQGTRVLEAMEEADEVIASLDRSPMAPGPGVDPSDSAGDMVTIVRGVRADIDPGALVDAEGHALWSPGPSGRVRELVHERDADGSLNPASLFELPGRTWVIASGGARGRARDAFARPLGSAPPTLDPDALALARIDGPTLVSRIPALRANGGLAALGGGMQAIDVELASGADRQIQAIVSYADEQTASAAERTLRELKDAVTRQKPAAFAWFAAATVERIRTAVGAGRSLRITAPLPPVVVDDWIRSGAARPPSGHL